MEFLSLYVIRAMHNVVFLGEWGVTECMHDPHIFHV
jgi:hypothetical protein